MQLRCLGKQGEAGNQAQVGEAEEMTEQEAIMLLDALREEERAARERMRLKVGEPVPVEKDW